MSETEAAFGMVEKRVFEDVSDPPAGDPDLDATDDDPSDDVARAASLDEVIAGILDHLGRARALAASVGRHDWVRKMEQLSEQVSGRRGARASRTASPVALAPVGPPMNIDDWLEETMQSLRRFRAVYVQAHEDDPASWPIERPREGWFEEWGQTSTAATEE